MPIPRFANLCQVASATVGTGTLTLGAAISGYLTPALAGIVDGSTVSYSIRDGAASEMGSGVYTASGTTLTRATILSSTNSGAAISCSGSQQVRITPAAEDLDFLLHSRGNTFHFYYGTATSDIGGAYLDFSEIDIADHESTTASLGVANDQLLLTFATKAGQPASFYDLQGMWALRLDAKLQTLSRTAYLYAKLYRRTTGGTETLLGTSQLAVNGEAVAAALDGSYRGWSMYFPITDDEEGTNITNRYVVKVYGNVSGAGSDGTIRFNLHEGGGLWAQVDSNQFLALITASNASAIPVTGWIDDSAETWTYASASAPEFTFTIAGVDLTTKYAAGQRVKLTQTTVKYFIITKVAFSTDTTVTLYGGTDYTLTNAAISANYHSIAKAPFGFPLSPAKWTVSVSDVADRSQATPTATTWYNLGSLTISIPTGLWYTRWVATLQSFDAAAATWSVKATLSTANNSESNTAFSAAVQFLGPTANGRIRVTETRAALLTLTAATSYYLNASTPHSNLDTIDFLGSANYSPTLIEAVCAYL